MDLTNLFKPLVWLNKLMGIQSKGLEGSSQTRQWVAARLFYQDSTQKSDILDPNKTQTELIAALQSLLKKGYHIELTAVNSDHHDDTNLNPTPPYCGVHAHGWAVDCWPLNSATPGDWVDASTHIFRQFLVDISKVPFYMQTGLVGDGADSAANFQAAGPGAFQDDGGAHIHIGTKNA
jgi:hypothetical protein